MTDEDTDNSTALSVPDVKAQFTAIQKHQLGDIIVRLVLDGMTFEDIAEELSKGTGYPFSPHAIAKFCRSDKKMWRKGVDAFIEEVQSNQLDKIKIQMSRFWTDVTEIAERAKERYIAGDIDENQLSKIMAEQRKFIKLNMDRLGLGGKTSQVDVNVNVDSTGILSKMRLMITEETDKKKSDREEADDVDYELLDDDEDALLDM